MNKLFCHARLSCACVLLSVCGSSWAASSQSESVAPSQAETLQKEVDPKARRASTQQATLPPEEASKQKDVFIKTEGDHEQVGLQLDIQQHTLPNGLRVVLSPDRTVPIVAVNITYNVGSRNEEPGRSGFAHLFEHMMFQGSKHVPRGEHFQWISKRGGILNGTTNVDRTNYFEVLPSSELGLALFLEADRIRFLDVSAFNFDNQRAVVKEERRMRVDNVAYVPAWFRLHELVYEGYWPYAHSTIGSMEDLDTAKLDWVRSFHRHYYVPSNAVLTVVGDFHPDEALALVQRFFGGLSAQSGSLYSAPLLPDQTSPREASLTDPHAKLEGLFYGWAVPASGQPDHYALEMAAMLLGEGSSSRMYEQLVRTQALATEVGASLEGTRGPDCLTLEIKLSRQGGTEDPDAQEHQRNAVETWVQTELKSLGETPPSAKEMEKLRNRIKSSFVFGLESRLSRAEQLAEHALFRGDATGINSELRRYLDVTPEDISRVVRHYLTPARSNRVSVHPLVQPNS